MYGRGTHISSPHAHATQKYKGMIAFLWADVHSSYGLGMTVTGERERRIEDHSRRTSESRQLDKTLGIFDDAEAHSVCY
jgi:hypothetical protein